VKRDKPNKQMKAIDRYIQDQKRSIKYTKLIEILADKSLCLKMKERSLEIIPRIDSD